jgi:hypothetical protein
MKEFKSKPLKGLEDLGDKKYSITRLANSEGGKISGTYRGNLAVERGTVIKAGKVSAKSLKHPNNVKVKCVHCGKENNVGNNNRWHGDNCKHKK